MDIDMYLNFYSVIYYSTTCFTRRLTSQRACAPSIHVWLFSSKSCLLYSSNLILLYLFCTFKCHDFYRNWKTPVMLSSEEEIYSVINPMSKLVLPVILFFHLVTHGWVLSTARPTGTVQCNTPSKALGKSSICWITCSVVFSSSFSIVV